MDPKKGYYNAKDDSITLEVWFNTDAPQKKYRKRKFNEIE